MLTMDHPQAQTTQFAPPPIGDETELPDGSFLVRWDRMGKFVHHRTDGRLVFMTEDEARRLVYNL